MAADVITTPVHRHARRHAMGVHERIAFWNAIRATAPLRPVRDGDRRP